MRVQIGAVVALVAAEVALLDPRRARVAARCHAPAVGDEALRELEREWRATGDARDGERFVQALRRTRASVVVTGRALYRSDGADGATIRWLRFFDDGQVLSVTTSAPAEPAQVARWFAPSHAFSSRGRWRLEGERLTFEAVSEYGRVDFDGAAAGDELRMRLHSHINDHRVEQVYSLVLLPG